MTQEPPKRTRRQVLKELFIGPKDPMDRIRQADVVLKDYGFKPVFETKTLEARRSEVSTTFAKLLNLEKDIESIPSDYEKQKKSLKTQIIKTKQELIKATDPKKKKPLTAKLKSLELQQELNEETHKDNREELLKAAKFQARKLGLLFYLFFQTGSPWVRGVDNEWLSSKVSDFINQYEDVGHLPAFLPMLHSECMQLLHMSWQGIDVTQMPDYIIQVMQPQNQRTVPTGSEWPTPTASKTPQGQEN